MLAGGQSQKWNQWEREVAPRLPDITTVLWLMAPQMEEKTVITENGFLMFLRTQLSILAGTSLHNSSLQLFLATDYQVVQKVPRLLPH